MSKLSDDERISLIGDAEHALERLAHNGAAWSALSSMLGVCGSDAIDDYAAEQLRRAILVARGDGRVNRLARALWYIRRRLYWGDCNVRFAVGEWLLEKGHYRGLLGRLAYKIIG